jgi:hypothetical protein
MMSVQDWITTAKAQRGTTILEIADLARRDCRLWWTPDRVTEPPISAHWQADRISHTDKDLFKVDKETISVLDRYLDTQTGTAFFVDRGCYDRVKERMCSRVATACPIEVISFLPRMSAKIDVMNLKATERKRRRQEQSDAFRSHAGGGRGNH